MTILGRSGRGRQWRVGRAAGIIIVGRVCENQAAIRAAQSDIEGGELVDFAEALSAINAMSIDDRMRLVGAIWDGIAAEQPAPELTEAQKQELDRRLAEDDVYKDARCALLRRFPYAIYYRVKRDRIVVIAVFHSSRDPREWQSRV